MLNDVQKKLKRLFAAPKARTFSLRVRCQLERLEDRAMLSASYGGMPPMFGGEPHMPHAGGPQHFNGMPVLASAQQQQQQRSGSQGYEGVSGLPPSHELMQSEFPPPPPRSSAIQQHTSTQPAVIQGIGTSPPASANVYHSEPNSSSNTPQAASQKTSEFGVWDVYKVTRTSKGTQLQYVTSIHTDDPYTALSMLTSKPPLGGTAPHDYAADSVADVLPPMRFESRSSSLPQGSSNPAADAIKQSIAQNTPPGGVFLRTPNLYGPPADLYDIPTAAEILTHESSAVSALAAAARDFAIQDYSPNLVLTNATNTYDWAKSATLTTAGSLPDSVDGLIQPTDESTEEAIINSSDVVARERDAIDTVLRELHDVDGFLPAAALADVAVPTGIQPESTLDELPAGTMDGGMVLLFSNSDPNDGGIDLTPAYARQAERFTAPAKMEASVGMFQAIDVATEDSQSLDAAPQLQSTTQIKPAAELDEKAPTKRVQSSTNKAAAIIGTMTLTGALVWMNRGNSRLNWPKPTAQKRRASRS